MEGKGEGDGRPIPLFKFLNTPLIICCCDCSSWLPISCNS